MCEDNHDLRLDHQEIFGGITWNVYVCIHCGEKLWALPDNNLEGLMSPKKMKSRFRRAVRKRDKVCQYCGHKGSKNNPLQVHHIKHRARHPRLVNDIRNCILLCNNCHREVHIQGG